MEFLRFGSSIPGEYWGCCAIDIIQNFNKDPDEAASLQLVSGDLGISSDPIKYLGPTYRDMFKQRLRIGTHSSREMPNHAFLAVLTANQVRQENGKKWLHILKENGFEFIRAWDNSVYTGKELVKEAGQGKGGRSSHINYLFALFRNVGDGAVADQFRPPKEWTGLRKSEEIEDWNEMSSPAAGECKTQTIQKDQMDHYKALGEVKFMTEEELLKLGVPITMAGKKSKFPPQEKSVREKALSSSTKPAAKSSPFG